MPIELPTTNVAGSPTRVNRPAALLTRAVMISGATKSTFSARATATMMGASSTTVVAFGSSAQTGAVSASSRSSATWW